MVIFIRERLVNKVDEYFPRTATPLLAARNPPRLAQLLQHSKQARKGL